MEGIAVRALASFINHLGLAMSSCSGSLMLSVALFYVFATVFLVNAQIIDNVRLFITEM